MDFGASLRRAWRMAMLDKGAIGEVAADAQATVPALIILAISGALSGIGSLKLFLIPVLLILTPLLVFIWVGILHLLAKLFGGQGSYMPLYNCYGHGCGLVSWLGVIPFVGGLVGVVWSFVIAVSIVSEVHKLTRLKAVLVVLIPLLVLGALCCGVTVLTGAAMWKMFQGGMQTT